MPNEPTGWRANLLDAECRFIRAVALRDYLLSLPAWHQERRRRIDEASEKVSVASRNLATWKRTMALDAANAE